jgi:uncharacterized protein
MPENRIKIAVKVHPNARKNEISGFSNEVLRVKIAAPADKGKANKELIEYFSDILGLKKENIEIVKGQTEHNKLIAIEGITREELKVRLKISG